MTQIADYRKPGVPTTMPEYDFAKVDQASICDDIVADSNMMIMVSKALAVALLILSATTVFFASVGVVSFIPFTGMWSLAEMATMITIAGCTPICFLTMTLDTLVLMKTHHQGQISLAETRKIELITGTLSK